MLYCPREEKRREEKRRSMRLPVHSTASSNRPIRPIRKADEHGNHLRQDLQFDFEVPRWSLHPRATIPSCFNDCQNQAL